MSGVPPELLSDKRLSRIIREHGSVHEASEKRWRRPRNPFHSLIRSIIYQQVSGSAAASILRRFKANYGNRFPKPAEVLKTQIEKLRASGLSGQKATYIRDLAAKFVDGTIRPRKFTKMTNEEIIEHLTRVKGIGVWTAHMFLIFTLKRPDILPTLDLGVRKGFQAVYRMKHLPTHEEMEKLAAKWRKHASLASLYMWKMADEARKK